MGHDVRPLGVRDDLGKLREAIEEWKPHVAFNMREEFHGVALYDQHVVSYLELMRQPYTGCNPRGLTLAHDKALSKKVLAYHRIPAPRFQVFEMGRTIRRRKDLPFPLFVKSLTEDASLGISQKSVVHNDEELRERVEFIHRSIGTDAIVEEFIEGRELYVGILGNQRLQVLPIWEMRFTKFAGGRARDRHREGQVGREVSGPDRRRDRSGQGPAGGRGVAHREALQAPPTASSGSAATPAWTCAWRPTAAST